MDFGHVPFLSCFQSRRMHVNGEQRLAEESSCRICSVRSHLHQSLMSFLGTRQASQTAIRSTGGLFWGVSPLFSCFQFLGKCHQPCRNGGKCTGKNKCKCSKGYQGDLCSKRKYHSTRSVLVGVSSSHRTSPMIAALAARCQSISG